MQVYPGEFILFRPVILIMHPFRLVAALRQQMHASHQIAWIEIFRINPWEDWHVMVLLTQGDLNLPFAACIHMLQQFTDKIPDQIRAQRP